MDEFESHLANQALKKPPCEWRAEILERARAAAGSEASSTRTDNRDRLIVFAWLRSLLWPHPGAWAGLAVIWLVIIATQWQIEAEIEHEVAYAKGDVPYQEVLLAVKENHRLMEKLFVMNELEPLLLEQPRLTPIRTTNTPPLMILVSGRI